MSYPEDPFWPPDPADLDDVTLGLFPYVLIQVHGCTTGFPPPEGQAYTLEIQAGGGLVAGSAVHLVRAAAETLEVADLGISPYGTLVQRLSEPVYRDEDANPEDPTE